MTSDDERARLWRALERMWQAGDPPPARLSERILARITSADLDHE